MDDINQNCSFCGKSRLNVKKLIAGPDVFICDECVLLSGEILSRDKKDDFVNHEVALLTPKKIKEKLDQYVIGQEEAKKVLSVAVSNHYKRLMFQNSHEIKDAKTNLLMIGPTSSGKTLLMRVLQKMMATYDIPIAFADATTLTEAGYVGEDVESILLRLLQEADFNIGKAQKGIVFIDEIDKIAVKAGSASMSRDVSGEGVQQALLGILQGKVATISPQRKHPNQESISLDTTDILFVCAGAFSGLEKIIHTRVNKDSIGFHGSVKKDIEKQYTKVETDDLIKFGMIPEFVGRLPIVVSLNDLSQKQLVEVLKTPKNALITQYQKLFEVNNAKLIFTEDGIEEIAKQALEKKVSARGLKGVIEGILQSTMFSLEDYVPCNVIVDKTAVQERMPRIESTQPIKVYMNGE